jgi:hypothetical protein
MRMLGSPDFYSSLVESNMLHVDGTNLIGTGSIFLLQSFMINHAAYIQNYESVVL